MIDPTGLKAAGAQTRRLFVYNGGFMTQPRIRRILQLAGWDISLGAPGLEDWVGVWGKSPTAPRGEAVAARKDAPMLRVEDSFLRSLHPGRTGEPPIGLNLDRRGVHFDSSVPSDLEHLLATHPLDDTAQLDRARAAIGRLQAAHLSKYSAFDPEEPVPKAPYVLVIDQTRGDASITFGGATEATFREMLVFAQTEHLGARIVIKSHPETMTGHRPGHFGPEDATGNIEILDRAVSPWRLFNGAIAVYTVSSQMGFEAIYAGHKPRVFGQPFYAGWGLTQDEYPVPRRERHLSRAQLFAAAMILYPTWYDPCRDRLCELETAIEMLAAETRAWRQDQEGFVALGMKPWKGRHMRAFFGHPKGLTFSSSLAAARTRAERTGARLMHWASTAPDDLPEGALRIEDGFLRSRGLGADLVPPVSLVADDLGIYYDPTRESRLERLIAASLHLPEAELRRAERLIRSLEDLGLSKYNLGLPGQPGLPEGYRILVPGQVEDDASIRLGCDAVATNLDLLKRVRAENPDAVLIYKPHPDVEAGLRPGRIDPGAALELADLVAQRTDPLSLIAAVDEVWTMTSLLGFEALLRDRPVTTLGAPFYAGWGLTRDLGKIPARRQARPSLTGLAHAALIGYPRYLDPVTSHPCPVEIAVERLAKGDLPATGPLHRQFAKLQGRFASFAPLWRWRVR